MDEEDEEGSVADRDGHEHSSNSNSNDDDANDDANEDANQMEEVLRHGVRSWQVREKTWLEVFRALRISSAITVSVFSLIAGLAMTQGPVVLSGQKHHGPFG